MAIGKMVIILKSFFCAIFEKTNLLQDVVNLMSFPLSKYKASGKQLSQIENKLLKQTVGANLRQVKNSCAN